LEKYRYIVSARSTWNDTTMTPGSRENVAFGLADDRVIAGVAPGVGTAAGCGVRVHPQAARQSRIRMNRMTGDFIGSPMS